MLESSFEELVKDKAKKQAAKLKEQAGHLGIADDRELKAFIIGSWDAMIFDMAHALNLGKYATHEHRQKLINKWLAEGL